METTRTIIRLFLSHVAEAPSRAEQKTLCACIILDAASDIIYL